MKKILLLVRLSLGVGGCLVTLNLRAGTNAAVTFRTNDYQIGPPGLLASNATAINVATGAITVQRGVGAFCQGLQNLGFWTNLVEAAWFCPGQNFVSPAQSNSTCNLIGLVQNSDATNASGAHLNTGVAVNCTQVSNGLLYSGSDSYIMFSNIPPLTAGMTLIVFYTQQGWLQNISGYYSIGGFFNTNGEDDCVKAETSGLDTYANTYDGTNNNFVTSATAPAPAYSDTWPHCVAVSTDRTNLSLYSWGGLSTPSYTGWNAVNGVEPQIGSMANMIMLGAAGVYNDDFNNMNAVVCGFAAFSNYMTLPQIRQVFAVAANTVLPWRRVVIDGDSLAYFLATRGFNLETNSAFFGNANIVYTAVSGTSIEQIINRFYPAVFTNFPNGQDIIFPSTEILWGAQNSFGGDTAAQIEAAILWEVQAVHASAGQIYIETPTESTNTTPTNSIEAKRVAVRAWELAGSSGADGVVDSDALFYNLLGTNYFTNTTYFADGVHPTALGYSLIATNINGVIGANLLTPRLFVNYPLQPIVDSASGGSTNYLPITNAVAAGAFTAPRFLGATNSLDYITNGAIVAAGKGNVTYMPGTHHSAQGFVACFTNAGFSGWAQAGHTFILFTNYWPTPFATVPACTVAANGNFDTDVGNSSGAGQAVPVEYLPDLSTTNYGVFGVSTTAGSLGSITTTNWYVSVVVGASQ